MSKYNYNKDYFSVIDSDDKAYWLGFLYADGCITRFYKDDKLRSMSMELTLCAEDRGHLDKLNKCLDSNINIQNKVVHGKNKDYYANRLVVNNTKFCYDLINLGCTPNKTFDIRLPKDDIVPKKYMRDFLRGFFDGDGCIETTKTAYDNPHIFVIITGIEQMLLDISNYLIENNIIRKIPSISKDKRSNAFNLKIYGIDTVHEFLDWIYKDSNMYLDRKYKKYVDFYKDSNKLSEKHGVYFDKYANRYKASIRIDGNKINLGSFLSIDDAINARNEAEIEKMKLCLSRQ